MKSIILYSTLNPPQVGISKWKDYHQISLKEGIPIYIRGELVDCSPIEALNLAKPREGEIVLNSIPFE